MAWEHDIYEALNRSEIEIVTYIPDSVIDALIDLVKDSDDISTYRATREEEAAAILSGAWLGGQRGALMCQSSGLATCFNALGSHIVPAGFPFLGLVTRRGALGEFNYAQVPGGYSMPSMLDDLNVANHSLDGSVEVTKNVERAVETTFATERPYVLLLEESLTGDK